MNNRKTRLWAGFVGVILGASMTLGSMAIAEKDVTVIGRDAKSNSTSTNNNVPNNIPTKEIQRFTAALTQIKSYYVKPVDDKVLFENAIRGMLHGLDPHSSYLNVSEYKELTAQTEGEFSGIGLEVTMEDNIIKVVTPLDNSPAAKAGVKTGDLIVGIDNTPVKGLRLETAINKMRGPKGSTVDLLIVRKGINKAFKVSVKRDVVVIKSVKYQLMPDNYAYIRLSSFQAPTANDLRLAISKLKEQAGGNLKGVVLDLRNNPGGLLDSAVSVANDFLNNDGIVVYTKGRAPGSSFEARAAHEDILNGAPIVILINGGTASAAEIVAGALQDEKRAIIMGTTSFGKGSVQTVLPLDGETAIKLTTALYYTPKGRSIQAKGITPDVVVDELDLSKAKIPSNPLEAIKEATLPAHLLNGNSPATSSTKAIEAKKLGTYDKDLAQDYQVQEAVHLLKGITVLKNSGEGMITKK